MKQSHHFNQTFSIDSPNQMQYYANPIFTPNYLIIDRGYSQTTNFGAKNINYNDKMKTQLCKNWAQKSFCPYNFKCQFAHGLQELMTQKSYKTKQCYHFFKLNYCKHGNTCNYSHEKFTNSGEIKTQNQNQIKLQGYSDVIQLAKNPKKNASRRMFINDQQQSEKSTESGQNFKRSQMYKNYQYDQTEVIQKQQFQNELYFHCNIAEEDTNQQKNFQFGIYEPAFSEMKKHRQSQKSISQQES